MFCVIAVITTKTISIEYIQGKVRSKSENIITNNQQNTKESVQKRGNKGKKLQDIKKTIMKWQK